MVAIVDGGPRWALVVTTEKIGAHHLWVTVRMCHHENICQLVHLAVLVSQRRLTSLGIMVVDEYNCITSWHQAPTLAKGLEILKLTLVLELWTELPEKIELGHISI